MAVSLSRAGFNVCAMHSDLAQSERDEAMYAFRAGKVDVLVATDIVARGIDIDDIQLVINYDVPHDEEDYVHRIGRTARAGRNGRAITLVNEKDQYKFRQIERFLEKDVEKAAMPAELGEGPAYGKTEKQERKGERTKKRGSRGGSRRRKGDKKPSQPSVAAKQNDSSQTSSPVPKEQKVESKEKESNPKPKKRRGRRPQKKDKQPPQTPSSSPQ